MHPVAHQMYRQTSKDDVFPLSKPIISKSGKVLHEVFVPKGTRLVAAVAAYNRYALSDAVNNRIYINIKSFFTGVRRYGEWMRASSDLRDGCSL